MNPKVTVLMAVYNGERYLREAIDSILAQTFTDFEFIIMDDASTDHSLEIIHSYTDQRIRLIRNECNCGLTASLNSGLDLARGEYVARMDADDISLPERLAKQVAFMDAQPDVGVCGAWAMRIDSAGRLLAEMPAPVGRELDNYFWRPSPLIHPTALIRFKRLAQLRYDCSFRYTQDYDFWLTIRRNFKLANLPEYLLLYRIHEESISTRKLDAQLRTAHQILSKHIKPYTISYAEFLALLQREQQLNPVRRALAAARLAKGLHRPYRSFWWDNLRYLHYWLRFKSRVYRTMYTKVTGRYA